MKRLTFHITSLSALFGHTLMRERDDITAQHLYFSNSALTAGTAFTF